MDNSDSCFDALEDVEIMTELYVENSCWTQESFTPSAPLCPPSPQQCPPSPQQYHCGEKLQYSASWQCPPSPQQYPTSPQQYLASRQPDQLQAKEMHAEIYPEA
eukprot:COSAG02_NODE_5515_length_4268_cov_2.604701_1_plen_103_part_10